MASFSSPKQLLAATILVCLLTTLTASQAFAKEIGIRLTPSIIEIRPQKDGVVAKSMTVENTGRDSVNLRIHIRAFTTDAKGEIIYPDEQKLDAATKELITNNIKLLENNIPIDTLTLAPGQKEQVMLNVDIKNIQKISQYTISVFFISQNTDKQTLSSEESPIHTELNVAVGSAAHLIIFGKKEDPSQTISISSFQTERFVQTGPVSFHVKAKNSSNKYINIYGNILITNIFGQQVGTIRIPNQLLAGKAEKEISGQSDQATSEKAIIWPEKFLVGNYKAKVTITADTGLETEGIVGFFAFPIEKALLILIALLIASFVIGQVREKVK